MREVLLIPLLLIGFNCFAQTHIEYISEKSDSMALISKKDIDVINHVFWERNLLDSLQTVNEQIIATLKQNNIVQQEILENQELIIKNKESIIGELEDRNENSIKYYSKELRKERNKKISFQATTGVGIIAIILILLL